MLPAVMVITPVIIVFCMITPLAEGLTSQEANYFESEEIPVVPGAPHLIGDTAIGTNGDNTHTLISNGIPDHAVGVFPNDNNLYPILEQNFRVKFPQHPIDNNQPTCLESGSIIGFATNGVAIYSPFDSSGQNVNIDFGDNCQGRTAYGGVYYYAQVPDKCSTFIRAFQGEPHRIYGVALDGFPIYRGEQYTNAQLDECHGTTVDGQYRYYMNNEWPYILGCFRGTPATVTNAQRNPNDFAICRFPCNQPGVLSSTYPCSTSPTTVIPTTVTPVQPPYLSGLTSAEAGLFESKEIFIIPGSPLYGSVRVDLLDGMYTLVSNGIPDHNVGTFPNTDNLYPILQQNFLLRFPQNPTINTQPTCLRAQFIIGFATNGVAIFSPFDNNKNNLNLDFGSNCQGRTSVGGIYYYAQIPNQCNTFTPGFQGHDASNVYGVALDGFPIYGPGSGATNAELDACHGKFVNGRYGYYMTDDWPYILGCFRGTPQYSQLQGGPSTSGVCKFACNKGSYSNTVPCPDDFPVEPPIGGPITTTTRPITTQPPGVVGVRTEETSLFVSLAIPVLPSSSIVGRVLLGLTGTGNIYYLTTNSIPDHDIGAYHNFNNPYSTLEQNFVITFSKYPTINSQPTCIPANSIIGFATNGVAIFSPFDNYGNNLNLQFGNNCQGRTSSTGVYYYAQLPDKCTTYIPWNNGHNPNEIYGVALDGFPIYGPGSGLNKVTNAQLDACHGKLVNGQYRYYITDEWPYVVGCFRGTPAIVQNAPAGSGACRFACNKDSFSNTIPCVDDFPIEPPRGAFRTRPDPPPITTQRPPDPPPITTQRPPGLIGLMSDEISFFTSSDIQGIPGSTAVGSVRIFNSFDSEGYLLQSNGIPDHIVDTFPNPNNQFAISVQNFLLTIPKYPTLNYQPTCVEANSIIGFATNGVAIFSPFDVYGNNVNLEFGNNCQGRTNSDGIYYYAQVPDKCNTYLPGYDGHNPSEIYGVALDGFPIYGPGTDSNKVTNAELDACHGKFVNGQYRYYMTDEWPYILGCFRGTPNTVQNTPTKSGYCRFACNKDSQVNTVPCMDSFPIEPPRGPFKPSDPSTTVPTPGSPTGVTNQEGSTTEYPKSLVGITESEISAFQSNGLTDQITGAQGIAQILVNDDQSITFISNGIPDHATGQWISLSEQNFVVTMPSHPEYRLEPGCLPSPGIIGFATNGVAIFSPYDAKGNDLNIKINDKSDLCDGRIRDSGIYYYTRLPREGCFPNRSPKATPNEIYGVALDGFPIYGPGDPTVKKEDLDVCHGRIVNGQYRYYMTDDYPYIIGCFRGVPQTIEIQEGTPTVPSFQGSCRFGCNLNGTTPEDDTVFCRGTRPFFMSVVLAILPVLTILLFEQS